MPAVGSTTTTSSKKGRSVLLLFLGLAVLLFWIMASLIQIQTTEAYLLSLRAVSYIPNWNVLQQPMKLGMGNITSAEAMAILGGWGVELIFLVCVVGYDIAHYAVTSSNSKLTKFFVSGMFLIVAFDLYTDYLYGHLGSGMLGQVFFAVIMGLIVAFFGIIGVSLIEQGIHHWR